VGPLPHYDTATSFSLEWCRRSSEFDDAVSLSLFPFFRRRTPGDRYAAIPPPDFSTTTTSTSLLRPSGIEDTRLPPRGPHPRSLWLRPRLPSLLSHGGPARRCECKAIRQRRTSILEIPIPRQYCQSFSLMFSHEVLLPGFETGGGGVGGSTSLLLVGFAGRRTPQAPSRPAAGSYVRGFRRYGDLSLLTTFLDDHKEGHFKFPPSPTLCPSGTPWPPPICRLDTTPPVDGVQPWSLLMAKSWLLTILPAVRFWYGPRLRGPFFLLKTLKQAPLQTTFKGAAPLRC